MKRLGFSYGEVQIEMKFWKPSLFTCSLEGSSLLVLLVCTLCFQCFLQLQSLTATLLSTEDSVYKTKCTAGCILLTLTFSFSQIYSM